MQKQKEKTVDIGNVFEDMEYPRPREALAKAKLILRITKAMKSLGLNKKNRQDKKKVAKLLHISSSDKALSVWNSLADGQLDEFTIGQLLDYLAALGERAEIVVRDASGPVQLQVATR